MADDDHDLSATGFQRGAYRGSGRAAARQRSEAPSARCSSFSCLGPRRGSPRSSSRETPTTQSTWRTFRRTWIRERGGYATRSQLYGDDGPARRSLDDRKWIENGSSTYPKASPRARATGFSPARCVNLLGLVGIVTLSGSSRPRARRTSTRPASRRRSARSARRCTACVCDRVGAQALREDLTGASFHNVCHKQPDGTYADTVDV